MTNPDLPHYRKFVPMHDGLYLTVPRSIVYADGLKAQDDIRIVRKPGGLWIEYVTPAHGQVQEPAA